MRTFQAIVGLLALLIMSVQTFRHVYVRWIEPIDSVLDEFDQTSRDISAAKSIDELLALYRPMRDKVREAEAKSYEKSDDHNYRENRELTKLRESENQLRDAIREWEDHNRKLFELHFFWWAGFVAVCFGIFSYRLDWKWLGLSLFVLGCSEMIWATAPSFSTFGFSPEFTTLLTFKVSYSVASLAVLFVGWQLAAKSYAPLSSAPV